MSEQGSDSRVARCRELAERSPLAMAVTGGEHHVLQYVNPAFSRLTGEGGEALVGRPFVEAFPRSKDDGSAAMLDRVYRTGEAGIVADVAQAGPTGATFYWSYTAWPLLSGGGRPEGLVVQVTDTTGEVRARRYHEQVTAAMREVNEQLVVAGVRERALAQEAGRQAAQLQALLESLAEGVILFDAAGRVALMNAAARAIWHLPERREGWGPEDYRGLDLRRPDGTPLPFEEWPVNRALRDERFADAEVIFARRGEPPRRLVFSGGAVRDEAGAVALAINVCRDVTELRELERAREESITLISHDLRTPLTVLIGQSAWLHQVLRQKGLEREAGNAEAILRNSRRLNRMIQDLVDSARLEAGRVEMRIAPVDLLQVVSRVVEQVTAPGDRGRVQVEAPEPVCAMADPERLERVLVNLVSNALKYSPPDSPVLVRLGRDGGRAVISVVDQGVGIAPEDLPNLFDKYYRVRSGRKPEGLGLGLYISRRIVDAHGGRIRAESEGPGTGSTFVVELSLAAESRGDSPASS